MERERLARLMEQPGNTGKDDLVDLRTMTDRYPWFSGAHLLLAIGDHAAGDVLFDEQLRTTAAHLPSRAILHDLVDRNDVPAAAHAPAAPVVVHVTAAAPPPTLILAPPPVEVPLPPPAPLSVVEATLIPVPPPPPVMVEVALPVVPELVAPPVVDMAPVAPVGPAYGPPTPIIDLPVPTVVPPVEDAPLPMEPTALVVGAAAIVELPSAVASVAVDPVVPVVPAEVKPTVPEDDPLDALIRGAALASTYGLLLEELPLPPLPVEAPPAPAPIIAQEPPPAIIPPQEATVAPAPRPVAGRLRFTEWLDNAAPAPLASLPATTPVEPAPQSTPLPEVVAAAEMVADLPAAPVAPAAGPDLEATKALIDRFIGLSAPAPAKKAEFFTPQQAAKRSLEDHADLVSETLARIHEKQGNISKAIAAYRKLAAKHPERAGHFNGLAEALSKR